MEYIRPIDFKAFPTGERAAQLLAGRETGATACSVRCIQVPPGSGSPDGRHTHVFEKFFYIISGTMDLEIDGREYKAGPGAVVYVPGGVPHRNWNGGTETVLHLAVFMPEPEPGQPVAQRVAGPQAS